MDYQTLALQQTEERILSLYNNQELVFTENNRVSLYYKNLSLCSDFFLNQYIQRSYWDMGN